MADHAVDSPETDAPAACEQHSAFELIVLVPSSPFLPPDVLQPATQDPALSSSYVQLTMPVSSQETVREIRQSLHEAVEAFWMGPIAFVKSAVELHAEPQGDSPPVYKIVSSDADFVQEFVELGTVFSTEQYTDPAVKRVLKVVQAPYNPQEARLAVLRFKEIATGTSMALQTRKQWNLPLVDPYSVAIDGGSTVFTTVRGPLAEVAPQQPEGQDALAEAAVPQKSSKNKRTNGKSFKGKVKAKLPPLPKINGHTSSDSTDNDDANEVSLVDSSDPLAIILNTQSHKSASQLDFPQICKSLALSPCHPPPHHLRLRGQNLYLTFTSLEDKTYQILGSSRGFQAQLSKTFVIPSSSSRIYHSLFELITSLSPAASDAINSILEPNVAPLPDFLAATPITGCQPANPWLATEKDTSADCLRAQTAYLLTGAVNADTMPQARDWNEDFVTFRELPKKTVGHRLQRERLLAKTQADFSATAIRAVVAVANNEVACITPVDSQDADSYLWNGILVTAATGAPNQFDLLGGVHAARVSASKDLANIKLLQNADLDKVHTMPSVVVDYCGKRWIAQAPVAGFFNRPPEEPEAEKEGETTEESAPKPEATAFRIVYGGPDVEQPDKEYIAAEEFEMTAKAVATQFNLAQHKMKDASGGEVNTWLSVDAHGIVGNDTRHYVVDLFRMAPVDVNFLEENIEASHTFDSEDASVDSKYPHKMTFLRPELLDSFREIKLRGWLSTSYDAQKRKAAQEAFDKQQSENPPKEGEQADFEAFLAKYDEKVHVDFAQFEFAYNPDAFVPRTHTLDQPKVAADEEDDATKNVRHASTHLREIVIPSFVNELINSGTMPHDGFALAVLMHRKGINMRYLGLVAKLARDTTPNATLITDERIQNEIKDFGKKIHDVAVRAMLVRGAKHAYNKFMETLPQHDLPNFIAHFLNCLLSGTNEAHSNIENLPAVKRTWSDVTAQQLRETVLEEVKSRFRFTLPADYFTTSIPRPQIFRELALTLGWQLKARSYPILSQPAVNGHANGKHKVESPVFEPEDVLNVVPIIKEATHKTLLGEEGHDQGLQLMVSGQLDAADAFMIEASTYYEQIFSSIHPDIATQYHTLAIAYHQLAQPLTRQIASYITARDSATSEEREKAKSETSITSDEQLAEYKHKLDSFMTNGVRYARNAVVVAERTLGIDASETLQQYGDLAALEQTVGNMETSRKLTLHVMAMVDLVYGPDHPDLARHSFHLAELTQSTKGPAASIPFFKEAHTTAIRTRGPFSLAAATALHGLSTAYALSQDLPTAITTSTSASEIFKTRLGDSHERTRESVSLGLILKQTVQDRERSESEKASRIARRLGVDNTRAQEILERLTPSSSSSGTRTGIPSVSGSPSDIGKLGHKSIEELLSFIEAPKPRDSRKVRRGKAVKA